MDAGQNPLLWAIQLFLAVILPGTQEWAND